MLPRITKLQIFFDSLSLLLPSFCVKSRPLQRCVSMLQTESLRKQSFISSLAYEKFGESASIPSSPISHFSVCDGVDALPVTVQRDLASCNWHQKSRAWAGHSRSFVAAPVPGSSGRAITKLVVIHFSAIRSVRFLPGGEPHNSIPITLLRTRLHPLFFLR